MINFHIDPIAVREERQRILSQQQIMEAGVAAADALLWFQDYARKPNKAADVLRVQARLVAGSTPNSKIAQAYVDAAAKRFAPEILAAAIEAAQHDFQMCEQIRKRKA